MTFNSKTYDRMDKAEKEYVKKWAIRALIALSENKIGKEIIFLMDKWNRIEIDDKVYNIKLVETQ